MNRPLLIFAAVTVLVALAAAAGWWAHRAPSPASMVTTPTSGVSSTPADRTALYWQDPMVPGQRFDKPGKSPFMDMPLVPVYAGEGADAGGVRVNSAVVQNLGIRLGKVERAVVRPRLSAVGSISFDEHRLELVQARVPGYVTKLLVKAPLDHVRRGQPLAEVTSPDWLQAQEEYAALLADRSESNALLRAAVRQKLAVLNVPEHSIAALERTGHVPRSTTIVAPIDGVITELGVREGSAFNAGATLFRINGLQTVWVDAQVPEAQRYLIPMASTVVAHATGWPGEAFRGRVEAVLPEVESTTRTLTVRAVLDNPGSKLSPGMFVNLDLAAPPGAPQLVVASEAVITTGQRTVVITAAGNGSFGVAEVATGAEVDSRTVIVSGLNEGQSIVLSGQFLIDSEASLTATINRLTTATAGPSP